LGVTTRSNLDVRARSSTDRQARVARPLAWLLPILAALVAATVAVGVFAVLSAPETDRLQRDVRSLRDDVGTLRARLRSDQQALARTQSALTSIRQASARSATVDQLSALTAGISRLQSNVHTLSLCLPELQRELLGMAVQTTSSNGSVTGARISTLPALPWYCSGTLSRVPR
jgi:septal ring factor EnvC (AmiA/AmiB activator)